MEYEIVKTNSLEEMRSEVNRLIKEGWIPQGGVMCTELPYSRLFFQAMILPSKKTPEWINLQNKLHDEAIEELEIESKKECPYCDVNIIMVKSEVNKRIFRWHLNGHIGKMPTE